MAEAIVIGTEEEVVATTVMGALGEQIQAIINAEIAGDTGLVERLRAGFDLALFAFADQIEQEATNGQAARR